MTPSLLPGLTSIAVDPLQAQADLSDRLKGLLVEEVRRLVNGLVGSAELFEGAWQRCVQAAARGETATVQAQRDLLKGSLARRLELLRRASALAGLADGGLAGSLADEMARLKRLQ